VPVPWYTAVESAEVLAELASERDRLLIVKPVDSRGARGVVRLLPGVDPAWAFAVAAAESPTGRVMAETFIHGPQVSTETLVVGGEALTVGLADRNYELLDRFAPFVIEDGGELPTRLPEALQQEIGELIADAARALGIRHGTVKGDVVIGTDGPLLIEIAARLSGGYFCTHEIPLATGVNFVEAAIRLALGEYLHLDDWRPRWSRGVAQRYLFPPPGRVIAIGGVDAVAAREGIALLEMRVVRDDVVRPMTSHVCRAGVVIAVAETRAEAMERAEAAVRDVHVLTAPIPAERGAVLH
jgi:biotin carboxylase